MHRLFVALRLPPPLRAAALAAMDGIEGARWQEDSQLHVTLRYIGDVERQVAEDIALALQRVRAPALDLALHGVGSFDAKRAGRSVWAGVTPHDAVTALHRKIDHALIATGLPPEGRAFLPHVTLARLNGASGPIDRFLTTHAGLTSQPARFDRFVLYESHLDPGGAWYEPVVRYPLD